MTWMHIADVLAPTFNRLGVTSPCGDLQRTPAIESAINHAIQRYMPHLRHAFERLAYLEHVDGSPRFKSPIELVLAIAIDTQSRMMGQELAGVFSAGCTVEKCKQDCDFYNHQAAIHSQVPIGPYTVDFLILYRDAIGGYEGIVVECDGHDFHERTKEQAAHDKARDRYLQTSGYKVLRFTGSEIWREPFVIADGILGHVWQCIGAADSKRMRIEDEAKP